MKRPGRSVQARTSPPSPRMPRTVLVLTERLPEPGMALLAARTDVETRVLSAPTEAALAAAIPDAVRLGPDAMWREGWAGSCVRAAALMPAAEASAFCQTVERALFGQPAGRDWTDGELAMQKALKVKIQP